MTDQAERCVSEQEKERVGLIERRSLSKHGGLLTATAGGRKYLSRWLPKPRALPAPDGIQPGDSSSTSVQGRGAAAVSVPCTPQFFRPEEFKTVEILTEMIIPSDGEPGGKEALVVPYIDFVRLLRVGTDGDRLAHGYQTRNRNSDKPLSHTP